jgi:hypothetical protein
MWIFNGIVSKLIVKEQHDMADTQQTSTVQYLLLTLHAQNSNLSTTISYATIAFMSLLPLHLQNSVSMQGQY